jgi:homoserine O-succinyltransferase
MEGCERLVRGFDELYYVPHSRHTDINTEQLQSASDLELLRLKDFSLCLSHTPEVAYRYHIPDDPLRKSVSFKRRSS